MYTDGNPRISLLIRVNPDHLWFNSSVFMLKLTVLVAVAEVPVRLAPPLADGSRARTKFISRHGKHFPPSPRSSPLGAFSPALPPIPLPSSFTP
jgi:hypothetical protein